MPTVDALSNNILSDNELCKLINMNPAMALKYQKNELIQRKKETQKKGKKLKITLIQNMVIIQHNV